MADELSAQSTEQGMYCVPTNAGDALFAKIVASGESLVFTKVLVGIGQPDASADPAELTGLVTSQAEGIMTDPVQSDDKVAFTVEYRNDLNGGLTTGFWLREFGVWARAESEEEASSVMVYYGCLGDYPQYVQAYDGAHIDSKRFPLNITVGNAESVTVSFSTDAFMTSAETAEYVASQTGELGGKTVTTLISEAKTAANTYTDDSVNLTKAAEKTAIAETDLVGVQAKDGTKPNKMTAEDFAVEIMRLNFAGTSPDVIALHNSVRRGKVLTDSYSISEILAMIAAKNYEDIWVGDIINATVPAISVTGWAAGKASFYVGEIESHSKYGDTKVTKGHVLCIPVTQLGTSYMNATNITTGGYRGSYRYVTVMPAVNTALESAFGSGHILTSRELATVAVNTSASSKGVPTATGATYYSSTSWHDCKARDMSENEVYGSSIFSSSGEDDRGGLPNQIALFKADPRTIVTGSWYWLSAVADSTHFCGVGGYGDANYTPASYVSGVRPRFLIG